MQDVSRLPQGLFPDTVISVVASASMWEKPVTPAEEACIAHAVSKRQREFRAGRHCAHQALSQLNFLPFDLLNDTQRVPIWPDNILGSISHCDDFCCAAVSQNPLLLALGLDVEPLAPLPDDVVSLICHAQELTQLNPVLFPGPYWNKVIFSAKETFYKCYFPLCRLYLDFLDAEVSLSPPRAVANNTLQGDFMLRLLTPAPQRLYNCRLFKGHYAVLDRWIITTMTLSKETTNV